MIETGASLTSDFPYIRTLIPSLESVPIIGTINSAKASRHLQSPNESSGRTLSCLFVELKVVSFSLIILIYSWLYLFK